MKVINQTFAKDDSSLLQLLEASITKEVISYNGAKCTVQVEPGYTAQELQALAQQSPDFYVEKYSARNNNTQLRRGLFYSETYKFSFVDESYQMRILVNNQTVKRVLMTIKSTNLENSNNFSNQEWLRGNADSVKRGCVIS